MPKIKNNPALPRAKGLDMAVYYSPLACKAKVKRLVLKQRNRQIIEEFTTILGMRDQFVVHEVPIPNKVVLFGPPGTGKTLTAFHLASQLNLPLILVKLDALIHSHLGETGSNVRKIFDYAQSSPCILFLDEFDAIARTRDSNDEVKEMARVVNTLLQCLDEFGSDSIFIAATNLEEQLDHAIWRRFDTKMLYELPDEESRREYLQLLVGDFEQRRLDLHQTVVRLAGCSYADIEQIVLKAKRKAIIEGLSLTSDLLDSSYAEYIPAK